jgi:putative membrane protein
LSHEAISHSGTDQRLCNLADNSHFCRGNKTARGLGLVNGIIGNFIRIVAFPLYILTLGLIALVVNALLLLLVSWISQQLNFGLTIQGFGWGVLCAIVLGLISWLLSILLRPLVGKSRRR